MVASEISFVVLFGIISFTNAKPDYGQDTSYSEPQHDLQKLLELFKQGNEDNIMLNHHEDSPGTHHEDTIQLIYKGGKPNSRYYNDKYHDKDDSSLLQGLRGKNLRGDKRPILTNIHNLNLYLKKKLKKPVHVIEKSNPLNKILKSLYLNGDNNLNKRTINKGDYYNGNRDYNYNIINENYNRHLRCNSKGCRNVNDRVPDDSGDNDRDDAYTGARSDKTRDENIDNIHCIGESCSNKNNINSITWHCIGDQCNRDNDEGDRYDDRNDRHHHRDVRDDVRDDKFREKNDSDDDIPGRHHHRDDREYVSDDRYIEEDNRYNDRDKTLRCTRGRCSRYDN